MIHTVLHPCPDLGSKLLDPESAVVGSFQKHPCQAPIPQMHHESVSEAKTDPIDSPHSSAVVAPLLPILLVTAPRQMSPGYLRERLYLSITVKHVFSVRLSVA